MRNRCISRCAAGCAPGPGHRAWYRRLAPRPPAAPCAPWQGAGSCQPRSRRLHASAPARGGGGGDDDGRQWRTGPAVPPSVHPHSTSVETALSLAEQLRGLMRLLAHSVVVCTARGGGGGGGGGGGEHDPHHGGGRRRRQQQQQQQQAPARAMTMSSFTSLALHPTPLVSFNVATPSRTLDAVAASGLFNIHVLAGDPAGARVADWFRRGNAEPAGVFDRAGECGCEVAAAAAAAGVDADPPLLRGPGVMYALRCRLLREEAAGGMVRVRDHVIVLGEVLEIVEGQRTDGASGEERFGLAYADRRYRQLGRTVLRDGGDEA